MRTKLFHLGVLAGVLLASTNQACAVTYTFTDLATSSGHTSAASAINNAGQVAGYDIISLDGSYFATRWDGTMAIGLGTLGGYSYATAINDAGETAGWSYTASGHSGYRRATLWNGTTATDLGTLGGINSAAYGINNAGQVVGISYITGSSISHATLWNGTTATDLGTLGGKVSIARDINNVGKIVGYSYTAIDSNYHATLWDGTMKIDLGKRGYASDAISINDAGKIVGYAQITAGGVYHAMLWDGVTPTDLGTLGALPGSTHSQAYAINNLDQIVGASQVIGDSNAHATLWNGTTAIDLNSFLDASTVSAGWVLLNANSINDHGWIVGNAINTKTGVSHAYLLTPPVPEPEVYAMLLAGIGLVSFKSRRRRIA